MDIAYYLSELLGELGEVNVPGLGSFTQQKIDGYYNDTEGKFYPPTADVNYHKHFVDDDVLAEYIAEKKKISLASSKYFIEKYSSKVSVEVLMDDVQIANLGWIFPVVDGIAFRKTGAPITPPAYYGYPKIELKKLGGASIADSYELPASAPKDEILPPVVHHEPVPEPEAITQLPEKEAVSTQVQDLPVNEPEVTSIPPTEQVTQPIAPAEPEAITASAEEIHPTIIDHEPIAEPEALTITHEEPAQSVVTEEVPVGDPVDLIIPEPELYEVHEQPAKTPLDFGASMEDYLRELEGGAYISGPETTEPVMKPEPVAEVSAPVVIPEPVIENPEPQPKPEPLVEVPKPEPFPESLVGVSKTELVPEPPVDVPFPEHLPSYTPDPELKQYVPDKTPAPQPEVYKKPVIITPLIPPQDEEEFVFDGKGYDDVDNRRNRKRSYIWLWIVLVILLLLAGAAAYLYYKHEQVKKVKAAAAQVPIKPLSKAEAAKKAEADSLKDSLKNAKDSTKNKVIVDTTEKAAQTGAATAIDSTKVRYEIMGSSAKTLKEADVIIKNYKSLGFDSHIAVGAPGRRLKISLGTFSTHGQALQKERELLKTRKVQKDIYILPINPKK